MTTHQEGALRALRTKKGTVIMEKKSAELKSRVTPEFKAEVEEKAKRAGMSTSDYIRIACGANSKIVILEDGKLIAQKLCESCALLESGTDSRQDMAQLSALLGDIYKVLAQAVGFDLDA